MLFDGHGKDSAREIQEYYVPNFTHWKNYDRQKEEFRKRLRDLKKADSATASACTPSPAHTSPATYLPQSGRPCEALFLPQAGHSQVLNLTTEHPARMQAVSHLSGSLASLISAYQSASRRRSRLDFASFLDTPSGEQNQAEYSCFIRPYFNYLQVHSVHIVHRAQN